MELKTLKDLHEKVKSGEINEADLVIILDNDATQFTCICDEIEVAQANGYHDVEALYGLLFPKATIDWV